MNFKRIFSVILLPSFVLLQSACGKPTSTPAPIYPTYTPIPPTSTPIPGPQRFPGVIVIRLAGSLKYIQLFTDPNGQIVMEDYVDYHEYLPDEFRQSRDFQPSPDHTHFLFKKPVLEDNSLYMLDIETRTIKTVNTDVGGQGIWSPDGKKIAYLGSGDGNVYVYDLETDQSRLIFEVPKVSYGSSSIGPLTTVFGNVEFDEDSWIGSGHLLFEASLKMPNTLNLGGTNPELAVDTSVLMELGDELNIEKMSPIIWTVVETCADGAYTLLYNRQDKQNYLSPRFETFSDIDTNNTIEMFSDPTAKNFFGFLPESCMFFYLKYDPNADINDDPVYLYYVDPASMKETRGPSFGTGSYIRTWFPRSENQIWLGDSDNNLIAMRTIFNILYLIDLNTGGRTCLLGQSDSPIDCIIKINYGIKDMYFIPK